MNEILPYGTHKASRQFSDRSGTRQQFLRVDQTTRRRDKFAKSNIAISKGGDTVDEEKVTNPEPEEGAKAEESEPKGEENPESSSGEG